MSQREADLYPPVHDYLELRFADRVRPIRGELRALSAITATAGGSGTGIWSKPDLCFAALWRHKYGTTWHLDLHGFEVKPKGRCSADAVHEALNHTSHVHFAHLVWHKPDWSDEDRACSDLLDLCRRFGVGLITLKDPTAADTFAVRLSAERHAPLGDAVDEFIETRLAPEDRELLNSWLAELRP
ncbi:MAG: hypothetical protein JNM89_09290 [Hyphomicrobiaceae bacterium]|nr:hypothetical protein [Hyphomicrobiaceae bacterium]